MDGSVSDGYELTAWMLFMLDTRMMDGRNLSWGKKLGRARARSTALITQCQKHRVVVSRQPNSKSARTHTDHVFSCLL